VKSMSMPIFRAGVWAGFILTVELLLSIPLH
jgi:hypothetical protein